MDVLVLGGSKFLGHRLVSLLCDQGNNVTVLNRGKTLIRELPFGVNRLLADRSDSKKVTNVLRNRKFDLVFDISGYYPSDVCTTANIFNGKVKKYIFCSTVAVYSDSEIFPINEESPLNRKKDADDYCRDKILCEDLLIEMFKSTDFPVSIIRPPYIYGPYDTFLPRLFSIFARLTQGREIIVHGDGLSLTHTVHVDDVASAFIAVSEKDSTIGQIYNVAAPEAVTFNTYVEMIASIMKVDTKLVYLNSNDHQMVLKELGHRRFSKVFDEMWKNSSIYSTEKIRYDLDWSQEYSMYDGLKMTYQWWIDNGLDQQEWDFSADDYVLSKI
jgi:dTDP-glucose 4,6-dehydratase